MKFDIYISYKRHRKEAAALLYYQLINRGYSAFYDLAQMRRDNFDEQIYRHIEGANDVFVFLDETSLNACKNGTWRDDWFCKEIIHALKLKKNIIPVLLDGYEMPDDRTLPKELKQLTKKHAPEYSLSYIDAYIDLLINKFITSTSQRGNCCNSAYNFYSDQDCEIYRAGRFVGNVLGGVQVPLTIWVSRSGRAKFVCKNVATGEERLQIETIGINETRDVNIEWGKSENPGGEIPKPISAFLTNMIFVNGGTFTMGATFEQGSDAFYDERPAHQVTLNDYYIGEYEVTQALWEYVMSYSGKCVDGTTLFPEREIWFGNAPEARFGKGDDFPAYNVSYDDIVNVFLPRLCRITGLQYRLPTEAEWEYAARGGNKSQGYKYSGSDIIDDVALYGANQYYSNRQRYGVQPIKRKRSNELGLYDMSGNVSEWCSDCYGDYSSSPQTNPSGSSSGDYYVIRGGSWLSHKKSCRVSCRGVMSPTSRFNTLGFRLARSK